MDDKPVVAHQPEGAKLALKQMIERKNYNDAVRRREFDKLRRLRLNPLPSMGSATAALSDFQDSWGYSVFEERANTLKKIDEIEAQMSKQWWKAHDGSEPSVQAMPESHGLDSAFATTMPSDLADSTLDVPTRLADVTQSQASGPLSVPYRDARDTTQVLTDAFAVSSLEYPDQAGGATDPVLEEAAIRFANGDDGGAESVLMTALKQHTATSADGLNCLFALLDLYHATAQRASFERVAADLANRLGSAAPVWRAQRPNLGYAPGLATSSEVASAQSSSTWQCPSALDAAAVLGLQAWSRMTRQPWRLDWQCLESMTPQAAAALHTLVSGWCEQSLHMACAGLDKLDNLLRLHTPMGETQVPQLWWQLRLALLRLRGSQDEFELVALDFCVTYEISPPSWQATTCEVLALTQGSVPPTVSDVTAGAAPVDQPLALTGEILGDIARSLPNPAGLGALGQLLRISCAELTRIDFSAGGSLLNWLATAQSAGCELELIDVPQLLVAFFGLIGINEHARVVPRTY